MFSRQTIGICITAVILLIAPVLVAASAVPGSGRTLAVMMPPWLGTDAQLAAIAETGVALRGGGALAGLGPQVWLVQVEDEESGRRLSRLPALLMSGSLVSCGV